MATFADMEIDPATGMPKLKKPVTQQLPYVNSQNPNVPLPVVTATPETLAQGNISVMGQAQNMAMKPSDNGIQNNTDAMVKKMQADPSFGYNGQQVKANALSNYDYNQANAVQTFKNQNADLGGHGEVNANLLKTILQQNTDRSNLENVIDTQNVDRAKKDWTDAIAAGNTQSTTNAGLNSQNIQNLLNVRGAYEGERAQKQGFQDNVALTNLGYDHQTQLAAQQNGYDLAKLDKVYGQDMAKLIASQNWQGAQAQLDRENAVAMQGTDIAAKERAQNKQNQFDLEKLLKTQDWTAGQASLDRAAQAALQDKDIQAQKDIEKLKQAFADAQRIATQAWQTGERLGGQEYDMGVKYFQAEEARALQEKDFEGQKVLATMKNEFDLNFQTQNMNHDEKMKYLDAQLYEAKAQNDTGRQKDILEFTYTQDLNKMMKQYGIDQSKMKIQGNIQAAINAKDYEHADAMQAALFAWQTKENDKNIGIEKLKIDLQAKGVDMAQIEQTYNLIKDQVAIGKASPDDLTKYLSGIAQKSGVVITKADELEYQKEIKRQFDGMKYEFLQTHPEFSDASGGLNNAGMIAFNKFYNGNMYAVSSEAAKNISARRNSSSAVNAGGSATTPADTKTVTTSGRATPSSAW